MACLLSAAVAAVFTDLRLLDLEDVVVVMTETGGEDSLISSDEDDVETTVALDSGAAAMPKSSLSNAEAGSMRSDISMVNPSDDD